jgi:diguanylate cyclase
LAQRVSRAMLVRKVPPTPQNYHVWYNYLAQIDADLANAIDALIHSGRPFTEQVNSDLYKSYILSKCADEQVRKIQQEMQAVLADIMENISSVGEATKDYGNHLETSASRLGPTAEISDVRSVLRLLADSTIGMARTAKGNRAGGVA